MSAKLTIRSPTAPIALMLGEEGGNSRDAAARFFQLSSSFITESKLVCVGKFIYQSRKTSQGSKSFVRSGFTDDWTFWSNLVHNWFQKAKNVSNCSNNSSRVRESSNAFDFFNQGLDVITGCL